MGNKVVKPETESESQMVSSRHFERSEEEDIEPMTPLSELEVDLQALREGVNNLSLSIDQIFDEKEDPNDPNNNLESRLQGMTRLNQELILLLTVQLERHAKHVGAGKEQNERLMTIVRQLVDIVNRYMAMLILNIRKLKRLISEIDASHTSSGSRHTRPHHPLYLPQTPGNTTSAQLVYDVIGEQLDVDSMLIQLIRTRHQREELEGDMVTVLVFWREYCFIRQQETDGDVIGRIEENVLAAADSVSTGLKMIRRDQQTPS